MRTERILLVDDDRELCNLISTYLGYEGFEVYSTYDGYRGLEKALTGKFDLVILDVALPRLNGLEVLRAVRKQSCIPVLMLTACDGEVDRVTGLNSGADDYLPKPFYPLEMVARIRAILRRCKVAKGCTSKPRSLVYGNILMDTHTLKVMQQGQMINLTAIEFKLLKILLTAKGKIVCREKLVREVLGREYSPLDRSIDVHISNLRKKLENKPGANSNILAIRGEGYKFTGGFPGIEN